MFSTHYITYFFFAVVNLAGLLIVQVSVEFQQKEAEVPEEVVEEKETVSKKNTSPKSSKKEKQSQKKHAGMILNNLQGIYVL